MEDQEKLKQDEQISFISRRWRNRRWMAWLSFAFLIIFTGILFVLPPERVEVLIGIYAIFAPSLTANIGFYFAGSSWEEVKSNK